jgi:hypothetical protein
MVGAEIDPDVYKCAWLTPDAAGGQVVLDNGYQCNGMHCCPSFAPAMIGVRNDLNILACQSVPGLEGIEIVDGNPPTEDGYMHVCPGWTLDGPSPYMMGGIQNDMNEFDCRK